MFFLKDSNKSKMIKICIYTTPLLQAGCNIMSIFKQSTAGLNSAFSFFYTGCLTKAKEPSLLNYLPIARGWTDRFMPLPKVWAQSEI